MLVAADLQRPAAIEQLHVIGEQLGVPVYSDKGAQDPVKVCQDAVHKPKIKRLMSSSSTRPGAWPSTKS